MQHVDKYGKLSYSEMLREASDKLRQASSKTKMRNSFLLTDRRISNKVTSPENAWLLRKPFNSYIPVFEFVLILVTA